MSNSIVAKFWLAFALNVLLGSQAHAEEVSVGDLLKEPAAYSGKDVDVIGLLHVRLEDDALYCEGCKNLQLPQLDGIKQKPALWLDFLKDSSHGECTARKQARQFDGTIVRVRGTFEPAFHGHQNTYPATLSNCTITTAQKVSSAAIATQGFSKEAAQGEQKQLSDLWRAFLQTSPAARAAIDALVPNDAKAETRERLIASLDATLFNAAHMHPRLKTSAQPSTQPLGLALTVPKLEPTYPVSGNHLPAYLLPMSEEQTFASGASMGSSVGISNTLIQTGKLRRLAERLLVIYEKYRDCKCSEVSIESHGGCTFYRQQLVDMAGAEAVDRLDEQLPWKRQ